MHPAFLDHYPLAVRALGETMAAAAAMDNAQREEYRRILHRGCQILHEHSDIADRDSLIAYALLSRFAGDGAARAAAYGDKVSQLLETVVQDGKMPRHACQAEAAFLTAALERNICNADLPDQDMQRLLNAVYNDGRFIDGLGHNLKNHYTRMRDSFTACLPQKRAPQKPVPKK